MAPHAPHRLDALRSVAASLFNRIFHGYGRHDAELLGRFAVPIHRTDAELRSILLGGAR